MTKKLYDRFAKSLQNPTKLSIMLLLAQNREMTVTQMSSHVGVTKASLYHSIAELMKDDLVSEPRVQVKKNYVEKYYRLNPLARRTIDPHELQRRFNQGANSTEYKGLLEAFFISLSLYFRMYAHSISNASQTRTKSIVREVEDRRLLLSSFSLDETQYGLGLQEVRDLLKRTRAREADRPVGRPENKIYIIAMPAVAARFFN
jgi:DNA-binding transcriptional ArsR family regulator